MNCDSRVGHACSCSGDTTYGSAILRSFLGGAERNELQGSKIVADGKKARQIFNLAGFFINNPGGFLLSHAVARAVPSAPRGLTSVFGMGTGVALSTQPPENRF